MGRWIVLALLISSFLVEPGQREGSPDAGADSCLDVQATTKEYFGRDDDSNAQWIARRYCQMKVASFERRAPRAAAAVRCVLHETFGAEMPVITLDGRDCVLWRVDWSEESRSSIDERAIPDSRCRRLQKTLDAFSRDQTPAEVEDVGPGVTITRVDGSEWIYEWWTGGRHGLGSADVEERAELEAPAALACTALFCATGAVHEVCRRDGGVPR